MAFVQVYILQSGRNDSYGLPLIPGSVVTVDRDYAVSLVSTGFASWMNPGDAYDGETNIRKPGEIYTLYQSGMPWWIPPGDGGANGLSFTGTRGVFTLSAEAPLAGIFSMFALGGYCYLPAGAGGLVTGGWYWFRMTDGTNGEVFAETYSGTGQPAFVSSPTAMPNLSAGRITQSVAELTVTSFILPGGAMGSNGLQQTRLFWATNSTGTKTVRLRVGSDLWISMSLSTSNLIGVFTTTRQNAGNTALQIGNRAGSATGAWDGGTSAAAVLGNFTTTDTTTDQLCSVTGQISNNTTSLIIVPMQFIVEYGA